MIRYLWQRRPNGEACGTDAADFPESDKDYSFLFLDKSNDSEGDEQDLDLRCPRCGHQEFIEVQEAVVYTPIQTVNGELRWMHHERVEATMFDKLETYYHCIKCGFQAPEPFDEWVEEGCPEEREDD